MATKVRFTGVDGVKHFHPVSGSAKHPEGRWHWAWETSQEDPEAHDREDAAHPTGLRELTPEQRREYVNALRGRSYLAQVKARRLAAKASRTGDDAEDERE